MACSGSPSREDASVLDQILKNTGWKLFDGLIHGVFSPVHNIDGFPGQSIYYWFKCPTSGGQMRNKEAAIQQTFHLERNSFIYLLALMVRIQYSATSL